MAIWAGKALWTSCLFYVLLLTLKPAREESSTSSHREGLLAKTRYHACRNNYSAERMVLVLLGGEPLETLEQWVRELFLGVPSGRGPRPAFSHLGRPYMVLPACSFPSTDSIAVDPYMRDACASYIAADVAAGMGTVRMMHHQGADAGLLRGVA